MERQTMLFAPALLKTTQGDERIVWAYWNGDISLIEANPTMVGAIQRGRLINGFKIYGKLVKAQYVPVGQPGTLRRLGIVLEYGGVPKEGESAEDRLAIVY